MRKVDLNMNELYKYEVIKNLVDTNGNKNAAATLLNCTRKHVNRLILLSKNKGKAGFIHGLRGKKPTNAFPYEVKSKIIALYKNEYLDTNFKHFCEIIYKDLGIAISDTTINNWLKKEYILSPKSHRQTKKKMKKELDSLKSKAVSKKDNNFFQHTIDIIDSSLAHPRRARCKYAGEMIQMDASEYHWIPNEIWHLHVAIDDATGNIVGAYFDTQETLKGYYNVFYQILSNYGIPAMFYTDKRTVFEYKRKDTLFDDKDTFTQFSYAAHQLGVSINTTSIPQAKGRVERLNQTLQSRLPVEFRRASITSIEQANKFLNSYIKEFNKQFALQLNDSKSVYETQPSIKKINNILAVLNNRVIDNGHSIKYNNNYYIPIDKDRNPKYFKPKTKCLVIDSFDDNLYINVGDIIYGLEKIEKHQNTSKEFDPPKKSIEEIYRSKAHIPPITHPWRHTSFNKHLEKQKHRDNSSANV